MSDASLTGGDITAAWRDHRPYLVNLAYQMLGDVGEAEDVAQEAFLRLSRADQTELEDVRGWLTVVAGRLCLDQLRSARVRLETVLRPEHDVAGERDPADRVTLDDEVHSALLEVLHRLTPGERVAFVLHDVFAVPFDEIAETVGRPAGTCRQLARRARGKFADAAPTTADVVRTDHRRVTTTFITACANGDLEALASVLDPTVWGVGTVLADPTPPPQVNHGRTRRRDEPDALSGAGCHGGRRSGGRAGAAGVRSGTAVRRGGADHPRREGDQDRGHRGSVGPGDLAI